MSAPNEEWLTTDEICCSEPLLSKPSGEGAWWSWPDLIPPQEPREFLELFIELLKETAR